MLGNRFPLRMKGKVYRCCVRSAILYGSETWCLKENKKQQQKARTKRAMVRAMWGWQIVDATDGQMNMLGLKETADGQPRANGVRGHRHVLRRYTGNAMRAA